MQNCACTRIHAILGQLGVMEVMRLWKMAGMVKPEYKFFMFISFSIANYSSHICYTGPLQDEHRVTKNVLLHCI